MGAVRNRRSVALSICLLVTLVAALAVAPLPSAEAFATRPVQLLIPYGAGGNMDMHARVLAAVAEPYLGQPLVPVIRAGAGGAIAAGEVARSRPDGHTLIISDSLPILIQPLVEDVPYRTEDFVPIGQLSASPMIINVLADRPWQSLEELLDYARANPGQVRYSTAALYSQEHLTFSALEQLAGVRMQHVPMGGGGPALRALLGGEVEVSAQFPTVVHNHIQKGNNRGLAVTSAERLPDFPDIPTLRELGYDHENYQWVTVFAPARTPASVIASLREAIAEIVEDPSFQALMERMGQRVSFVPGDQLEERLATEKQAIEKLLKAQGLID